MRIRFTLAAAAALAVLSACGTPTITDTADQEAAISKPEGTTQAPAENGDRQHDHTHRHRR